MVPWLCTTSETLNQNKEESKKEEIKPVEENKKPKTVRKKKTADETKTEEAKPVEKKKGAPRKKKTDTA